MAIRKILTSAVHRFMEDLSWKRLILIVLGAAICTFGIHNIHQRAAITEGGIIGLMLLLDHWAGFSPAVITPILDIACYLLAFKYLGGRFIKISVISTLSVALFYKVCSRPCCRICRHTRFWPRFWAGCLLERAWGSSYAREAPAAETTRWR